MFISSDTICMLRFGFIVLLCLAKEAVSSPYKNYLTFCIFNVNGTLYLPPSIFNLFEGDGTPFSILGLSTGFPVYHLISRKRLRKLVIMLPYKSN